MFFSELFSSPIGVADFLLNRKSSEFKPIGSTPEARLNDMACSIGRLPILMQQSSARGRERVILDGLTLVINELLFEKDGE